MLPCAQRAIEAVDKIKATDGLPPQEMSPLEVVEIEEQAGRQLVDPERYRLRKLNAWDGTERRAMPRG